MNKKNYNKKYGCKNCKWFRYYPSNSYYEPDDYECSIDEEYEKKIMEQISYSCKELDDIFEKVFGDGEEWDSSEEQLCPYYKERIKHKK